MPNEEHRRLAAIMFTDMVGYSALTQRNEALALALVDQQQRLLRPIFAQHDGREVKGTGDGFLVEFSSALQAAQCAIEAQRALVEHNASAPAERRIQVRIGLHLGDVVSRDGDVFGDGVNIAARIEPLAEAGGICLSRSMYDQIHNKINLPLVGLGLRQLKNIAAPIELYKLVLPWQPGGAPRPPRLRPDAVAARARAIGVALLACVLIAGGVGWWRYQEHVAASRSASAPSAGPRSIAVLPFVNMGADASDEYLSDGMTEEIITALSKVSGLRVAARTSSFAFKGRNESVEKIGRQLHVGTVLEGSVSKAGNKLRITTQLIDVADGYHLWSENYDREMQDVFSIRSDVAQRVADALKVELGVSSRQRIGKKPTDNLEAYNLYLKGRYLAFKATEDGVQKGIEAFQQAIAIDPNYALAYAGLAEAYQLLDDWFLPPREVMPKAREAAAKALAIDDTLAEAHTQMATVYFWYDWDWSAAEREIRRAIELNDSYANAHGLYGMYLASMGRLEEGIAENERAVALDPLSAVNGLLGQSLYWARRYDAAITQLQMTLEIQPSDWFTHVVLGRAYLEVGRVPEAIAEFRKATTPGEGIPAEAFAALARGYAVAGQRADAQQGLDDLLQRSKTQHVPPYNIATVYAALGETDRAFECLDKAYGERSFFLTALKVDPEVDPLRADPRFAALLKKVGLEP